MKVYCMLYRDVLLYMYRYTVHVCVYCICTGTLYMYVYTVYVQVHIHVHCTCTGTHTCTLYMYVYLYMYRYLYMYLYMYTVYTCIQLYGSDVHKLTCEDERCYSTQYTVHCTCECQTLRSYFSQWRRYLPQDSRLPGATPLILAALTSAT